MRLNAAIHDQFGLSIAFQQTVVDRRPKRGWDGLANTWMVFSVYQAAGWTVDYLSVTNRSA